MMANEVRRTAIWRSWADTFWPHIDTHCELFPFIHAMYSREMVPGKALRMVGKAVAMLRPRPSAGAAPHAAVEPGYPKCDVLFVALGNRANCVGVGRRVDRTIRELRSPLRMAFFQPAEEVILDASSGRGHAVITMGRHLQPGWVLRFARLALFVYAVGMRRPSVRSYILRHPAITLFTLLKALVRCGSCRHVLRETEAKAVMAANEGGVSSSGAALFAVAREMGIRTVQYLHGMPNPMWFPFLSDEFWVWSELTISMFRHQGVEDSLVRRMLPVGSLEYDDEGYPVASPVNEVASQTGRRILVFSQLGCDPAWGTDVFTTIARRFAAGLSGIGGLQVRIRLHPNEHDVEADRWRTILAGVPVEVSPRSNTLTDDVAWSTHAYSNGSTAILAALKAGKACYLLWDEEMNSIHGCPPFPEPYVAITADDVRHSVLRPWMPGESAQVLDSLANSRGAIRRAVGRLAQISGLEAPGQ